MKISALVTEYIIIKKAMGMRFRAESVILNAFCRAMNDIDIVQVNAEAVQDYLRGTGPITTFWHRKFEALNGFYRFALNRGCVSCSPLPTIIPKRPAPFQPYIYTRDEFRRLVEATDILGSNKRLIIQPATFRTLLIMLYGTGLRIGEALSLTMADVEISKCLLTIRNTKFFKTRWVPIGPQLTDELISYAEKRRQIPRPAQNRSAFFPTKRGDKLALSTIERIFRLLCENADIHRIDGGKFQPRLHDIRYPNLNKIQTFFRISLNVVGFTLTY